MLASLSDAPKPAPGTSFEQQLRQARDCVDAFEASTRANGAEPEVFVLIDAATLEYVLDNMEGDFAALAIRASVKSVLCCRVTPKQKGRVVRMVKEAGYVTLAVGDGGNDVPMIQEAHLGVGIVGKEGLQAARAADYSIGKFMFLARLVLVHGHWAYHRTCFISQYSFYRCFFFCMFQLSFNTQAGYSGSSWFLSLPITLFNAPFTGLSSFFFVLDRNVSARTLLTKESYKHHSVYKHGIDCDFMNLYTVLGWLVRGTLQGIICAWIVMGTYGSGDHGGHTMDQNTTSMVAYTVVIVALTISVYMESSSTTYINHLVVLGCFVLFIFYIILTGYTTSSPCCDVYGITPAVFGDGKYWLTVMLGCAVTLLPVLAWNQYIVQFGLDLSESLPGFKPLPMDYQKVPRPLLAHVVPCFIDSVNVLICCVGVCCGTGYCGEKRS